MESSGIGRLGDFFTVGDENDDFAEFRESFKYVEDFGFRALIEVAGGFVGNDDRGVASDGSSDSNTLLLTTREFLDETIRFGMFDTNNRESFVGRLFFAFVNTGKIYSNFDVFAGSHITDEIV